MKILGLDLGIASIGSALVDFDSNNLNNTDILHSNVRIFETPQTPKDKISLQKIRGEKRRARNSNENYAIRRKKIVNFIIKNKLVDIEEVKKEWVNLPKSKKKRFLAVKLANYLFKDKNKANDILELRYKAINELLTKNELARLLYSMNNHRGVSYEDSRSSKNISDETLRKLKSKDINDYADGSSDKLLYGLINFKEAFADSKKYKTVGEFLYKEHKNKFRNTPREIKEKRTDKNEKGLVSDFMFVIPRKNITDELNFIFNKQMELNNDLISNEFAKEYLKIFEWEEDSPSFKDRVAPCLINDKKLSSSKHKAESILYIYLEKFYNLSYKTKYSKRYENLKIDDILVLIDKLNTKEIKYSNIKSVLEKDLEFNEVIFKGIDDYSNTFIDFKISKNVSEILNLSSNILELYKNQNEKDLFNAVIEILAYEPKIIQKEEKLKQLNLNTEIIDKLLEIKIKGNLSYCEEVLEQICNGMISGLIPHYAKEAVENSYPKKKIIKGHLLPPIMETDFPIKNNHVVVRALSQMRLVVNDTLKHYRKLYNNPNWFFDRAIIETGKEFLSEKTKNEHKKTNKLNEDLNKEAIAFCEKYGKPYPSKEEILRARLYLQQKGFELYPCSYDGINNVAKYNIIEAEKLFDESYCEIDHTLPISRSLDDSFANKTLVLSSTNQNKGNKTPYEFLDENLFKIMETALRKNIKVLSYKKVDNLTNKDFKELDGFTSKDLNDTRIITKYAGLYIDKYLSFPKDEKLQRRVFANNGKITSLLRKSWGIGGKNRNTHLHHGEDAILIALSNNSLIKHIATFFGIQTQLENFNFSRKSFNILFKNETNLKDYVIDELKKQGIDIDNLDIKNINKKEIINKIFRVIAKKSYPREDFIYVFKKTMDNAVVTHQERIKTNGQIHLETINKINEKAKKEAVLVRGGISDNGETLRYDIFKKENKFDFIRLTAKHNNVPLQNLPSSSLVNSDFLFSINKNSLLEIHFAHQDNIFTKKGLFSKIDANSKGALSYLYLESIENKEDDLLISFVSNVEYSYILNDSINKETIKNIDELIKKNKIEITQTVREINTINEKILIFVEKVKEQLLEKINIKKVGFNIIPTSNIIKKIKDENKELYNENDDYEIIINIKPKPSSPILKIKLANDGKKTNLPMLIDIRKVKTDTFGNENIILKEERLPLM